MTLHLIYRHTQRDRIIDAEQRRLHALCQQREMARDLAPRIRWWRLKRLLLRFFWRGLR